MQRELLTRKRLIIMMAVAAAVIVVVPMVAVLTGTGTPRRVARIETAVATLSPTVSATRGPVKGLTDAPAYQWWVRPGAPELDSWWGANQDQQTLGMQVALMHELGTRLFRIELPWPFVAPTMPGTTTYDSALARNPDWSGYDWTRWDLIVRLTQQANIEVVPQVVFTPPWANGIRVTSTYGPNSPPTSAQYYADFVHAAVTRYKGVIHYWELWNEPDYWHTWNGTGEQYVQLILKPGYTAVKEVDPTARVLLGGLADVTKMKGIYAAGGEPYFDIGNFHAYFTAASGDSTALSYLRGVMNQNGDRAKPIWLTEFGYPTHAPTVPGDGVVVTPANSNETGQAGLIRGVYAGLNAQAIFLYQLHDGDLYNAKGVAIKQGYWGLVTRDLSRHKPGFDAYQAAAGGSLPPLTAFSLGPATAPLALVAGHTAWESPRRLAFSAPAGAEA